MRTSRLLFVLLLSAAVAACASQQGRTPPDVSLAQNFVPMAASGDQFEIQSSKLALSRSHDKNVRRIARQMIKAHTASSRKLMALLKSDRMQMPQAGLMPHQQRALDILHDASDFDQQYLETQDVAHKQAIRMFQTYSQRGDNPDLQDFATKILPILYKHKGMIEKARGTAE